MARFVALRDRRLNGALPVTPQLDTFHLDSSTSIDEGLSAIAFSAGRDRVKALFVLCHGFAGENRRARVNMDAGGMGLLLGRENVVHSNVSKWRTLRNKVENIVVYSCGAADTQPGNEGSAADGRYLMGALAIHTNSAVFAADRIQWYRRGADGTYNFGAWEGNLFRFDPDGYSVSLVSRPPFELSDVLAGSA